MTNLQAPIGSVDSTTRLLQEMSDTDWRVRRNAVAELASAGDKNAVQAILGALRGNHGNLNIASSAIRLLAGAGIDTAAALIELLSDSHPELRCCAALILGLQNHLRAVPGLLAALADGDSNVRYHAIEALGSLRTAAATDALISIAETEDFTLAFPALEALTKVADARVADRLIPLLSNDLLQSAVITALGVVGDGKAIPALVALLNDPDAPADAIAQSLVCLHDRFCAPFHNPCSRDDFAHAVNAQIDNGGVQNLLDALKNADRFSSGPLVTVLTWLGNPDVDRVLVNRINQPVVLESFVRKGDMVLDLLAEKIVGVDLEIRQGAVTALGRIGSKTSVPALLRVLTQDAELTVVAAGALAMMGDQRAYAPLLELLESEEPAIRRAAVSALNSLGHAEMAKDMAPRMSDPRPNVRECAARIVGYAGYPEMIDLLVERCTDEEENVRKAAVESLPWLEEDSRIEAALQLAMSDPAASVRAAAARTLGKFSATISRFLLRQAVADSNVWVRYYAVRSLARLQDASALGELIRLTHTDSAVQVRVAAVEAIGKLGGPGEVNTLATLTDSSEIDLARAALAAVGAIGGSEAVPVLSKAIVSGDVERKLEAIRALGMTRSKDAVAPLMDAASSSGRELALAAIDSLQRLALREAINALIDLTAVPTLWNACTTALAACDAEQVSSGLGHPLLDVRLAVVKSLARARNLRASTFLGVCLEDAEGAVRYSALNALACSGYPPAKEKLAALAEGDADSAVRRAAQAMLRG